MPIYEYQGQRYEIADTDPDVAKSKILDYLASQEEPVPPPTPETGFSAFMPAVKRGALGIQSLVADVAPAMAARVAERFNVPGAGEYARKQMQEAQEAQEYAQRRYPSAVPSYTDIKGGGDLLTYVVESVGELIPSMIPSILTGGAAGIAGRGAAIAAKNAAEKASYDAAQKTLLSYSGSKLSQDQLVNLARQEAIKAGQTAAERVALKYQAAGAVGGSAIQNIPEVYQNVAEETGKEDLGAALLFGGFNSVLDAITPIALLRKAKGIGLTEKELIGAWYKRAGKGVLTGFATEGSTEAVQEMSSAAAEKFVDNNKEFFTKENFERFINAGLKGGIGGGAASGVANIPFGRKEAPEVEPTEAAAPVTPAEIKKEAAKPKLTDKDIEDLLKPEKEAQAAPEAVVEEPIKGGQDVTNRIDVTGGGAGAKVPSGSEADRAAEEAAAPKRPGVADAGSIAEQAAAREAEQQRPLEETKKEEVLPEVAKKEEAAPVVTPPKAPPNAPEQIDPYLQKLIETEKTRQKGLVKDTRTLEDKAIEVRLAPKTKEQEIQRQQQIKALQAKQAKELAKDIKLTPEQKESNKAAKNYLAAANNDEKAALKYLAFDLGVGVKGGKGAYKPGTGGAMATAFYKSLTPEQKKIVDFEKQKWEEIEAGTASEQEKANKAIAARKAKQEKDIKSVEAQIAKKETVAKKEATAEEKLKAKLQQEKEFDEALQESEFGFGIEKPASYSYYDLNRDLYGQASDVYGGTNPDLMGHLLHGDLHSALEVIAKDTTKAFTPFDKEVAKRLLLSKSLPSVSVEPASFIKELADANGIKGVPHGVYSNGADHIYLNERTGLNSHIVLHEVTHGYTVSLIRAVEKGKVQNAGVRDLGELYDFLKVNHPELATEYAFETKDLAEFASEVMSNRNLQDKLRDIPYKRLNAFTEFARAILRLLGIGDNDKSNALAAALISTDRILGTGRAYQETAQFEPTMAAFATDAEAKAEPEPPAYKEGITNLQEWMKSMPKIPDSPAASIKKALGTNERYGTFQKAVKALQNNRRAVLNWEKRLERANKIIYYGENQNNIFGDISASAGRAEHNFNFYLSAPSKDLYSAIGRYAEARGLSDQDALLELQQIFVSLHEPERRRVKYLLTVPLPLEAAIERQKIMNLVRSNQIDEAQSKLLRTRLDALVENNKLPEGVRGYGADPNEGFSTMPQDEQSAYYNVVSGIDPKVFEMARQQLYEPNKALIKPIQDAIKAIQAGTKELDTRANYWSQPVNNIVSFYGYDNYVPFKGKPGEKLSKVDEELEPHSKANGKELQEAAYAFEGRLSDPDNPLLQTLADGVRSALRSGRGGTVYDLNGNPVLDNNGEPVQFGTTHAIVNAIKQGLIEGNKGKPVATITFEQRYDVDKIQKIKEKGENTFFHYKPDGTIEVWAIDDPALREAIRRTYQQTNPLIDTFSRVTSFIGQGHTRYNPAFAPKNFVADTLANAGIIGAEFGVGKFGAVVGEVAKNGLGKAFTFSKLYGAKKFDEIEKLAKTDDYIRDMYEYVKGGGKVSYVSGIGAQSQFQRMQENLGRSAVASTKEQVDSVLDTFWAEPFELASRVAAYRVTKADFINNQGMNEQEAKTRAISYVKNLANFEQTGDLGKLLGSFFVFFRASATGAVRAIDAISPLFVDPNTEFLKLPDTVRANPEAKKAFFDNYYKQRRTAAAMLTSLFGVGFSIYMMALLMSDKDDEGRNRVAIDDMDRWTRFARFPIPGTDKIVQIPWGFGLGAFAAAGAQIASLLVGNSSFGQVFNNIKDVGMDSFIPLPTSKINMYENPAAWAMDSITPSIARPFFEYAMNIDGLGREIYNNRQSRVGDAYTGGDNIPELYKDAARMLANVTNGGIDVSPNTMYFFANNYLDGLSRVIHNSYGIGMTVAGKKEFNPKTDTMVLDSFFGAPSNIDAREFTKVENQIKDKERKLNMFKSDPVRYAEYIADNPLDEAIVEIYNKSVGGGLNALREQSNMYRKMPDLSPKDRKNLVDIIKGQENLYKRHLIEVFKAYDITP